MNSAAESFSSKLRIKIGTQEYRSLNYCCKRTTLSEPVYSVKRGLKPLSCKNDDLPVYKEN